MKLIQFTQPRGIGKDRKRWALFECLLCGESIVRRVSNGRRQKSCGCIRIKHGLFTNSTPSSKLYYVWGSMLNRCKNPQHTYYGANGIKVCLAWHDFATFKTWAEANGYKEGLYIDRRNGKGNYEPRNCRWVTPAVSAANTRLTRAANGQFAAIEANPSKGR